MFPEPTNQNLSTRESGPLQLDLSLAPAAHHKSLTRSIFCPVTASTIPSRLHFFMLIIDTILPASCLSLHPPSTPTRFVYTTLLEPVMEFVVPIVLV